MLYSIMSRTLRLFLLTWFRRALQEVRRGRTTDQCEAKLKAVRRAAKYSFPTADIQQVLERN
jgi:hypothetical protein